MKKTTSMGMAALVAILAAGPIMSATIPQTADEHLGMATSYDERAEAQAAVVKEHEDMRKAYNASVNDKTPPAIREKMDKHCGAIIKDAKKLQDDFKAFAQWHHMRAAELQGK
jgi:hypothetical protein